MSTLECCLSYAGDHYDNELRMALGHHPQCRFFPVEVKDFRHKATLARQVEAIEKLLTLDESYPLSLMQMGRIIGIIQERKKIVKVIEAKNETNSRVADKE